MPSQEPSHDFMHRAKLVRTFAFEGSGAIYIEQEKGEDKWVILHTARSRAGCII